MTQRPPLTPTYTPPPASAPPPPAPILALHPDGRLRHVRPDGQHLAIDGKVMLPHPRAAELHATREQFTTTPLPPNAKP